MPGVAIPNGLLTGIGRMSVSEKGGRLMLDLVYAAVGVLLIALMGVYADACRRL
jgi:hypothetical protein